MNKELLLAYSLAAIISVGFFLAALILAFVIFKFSKRDPKESEKYLKNIIYSGFGGIIAVIFLEAKGQDLAGWAFWTIRIPSILVTVFIFIILGFVYLKILDWMFRHINSKHKTLPVKKVEKTAHKTTTTKRGDKRSLESFFSEYKNILLVLSIFLLVTLSLVFNEGYLNNILALLSALITYLMLIGIDLWDFQNDSYTLSGFKIVLPIFISAFCVWTILNVIITLNGEVEKSVWIIVWLILMLIPSIKWWKS